MNTSLERRQRRRRNGGRPGGGSGPARAVAIGFPLFLFASFFMLGIVGFVATVGAYSFYSQGLPDPKTAFDNLGFDEQTIVYDRTGKVELARFGQTHRQVIDIFAQLSPSPHRRDDLGRGPDLLEQRRLRPGGHHLGGRGDRVGQRPWRVDDHPAAGPGAPAARERVPRFDLRPQDPRDHPVDPADPGLHRPGGQAPDHDRLPQPELSTATRATASQRPPSTTSGCPTSRS